MTFDLFVESQSGNSEALLTLIDKFKPLLKKYAYLLKYEDAYNDLQADFIEIVQNIQLDNLRNICEGALVSYINTSIHNRYIRRSVAYKDKQKDIYFSELDEHELYFVELLQSKSDSYIHLELSEMESVLTKAEYNTICMYYIFGYSVEKIALCNGVSRQAVNRQKLRALEKLKNELS